MTNLVSLVLFRYYFSIYSYFELAFVFIFSGKMFMWVKIFVILLCAYAIFISCFFIFLYSF